MGKDIKLNIIVTPEGVQRVSVYGDWESQAKGLDFYRSIVNDVNRLNKKIQKARKASD